MIASRKCNDDLRPFTDRIQNWSKDNKIGSINDFIKERRWKIKAIGNTELAKTSVSITDSSNSFCAIIKNPVKSIFDWLPALAEYTAETLGNSAKGSIKYQEKVYDYSLEYNESTNTYKFIVDHPSSQLGYLLRRVIYKSAYCINCEVCEVDCPTGALSILPDVKIDKSKCIHCHRCLTSHELGCISADCVRMIVNMNNNENTKIQAYKTFGFREEWLQEYLVDPEYFWQSNSLGTAQVDGFKAWLKDAEINDAKNKLTRFGELLQQIYVDDVNLTWELILTNLSYNSFIVNWFVNNVKIGQEFDRKILEGLLNEQGYSSKGKTVANAVAALVQTFEYSPLGEMFNMSVSSENKKSVRQPYQEITNAGLAYSLYKYAEKKNVRSLRVSDFFTEESKSGPHRVLGISKTDFLNRLRSLNSKENRVLIAELSMGLDSITLRDDLNSISCLETLICQ